MFFSVFVFFLSFLFLPSSFLDLLVLLQLLLISMDLVWLNGLVDGMLFVTLVSHAGSGNKACDERDRKKKQSRTNTNTNTNKSVTIREIKQIV